MFFFCFSIVCPFFSRDLRGSEETENPFFFVVFLAFSRISKERKIRERNTDLFAQCPTGKTGDQTELYELNVCVPFEVLLA